MTYPNSACEFRFFKKLDGSLVLQVRYVCEAQGYVSLWSDVPIIEEQVENQIGEILNVG